MSEITVKNLVLRFEGDQITKGTPREQAQEAVRLINGVLQRQPYGLAAQIFETAIDNSDVECVGDSLVINGTVKLPRCWETLLNISQFDILEMQSGRNRTNVADPDPYYDDAREIPGTFENGDTFIMGLYSGQSNYYGGITIHHMPVGDVLAGDMGDEPIESWGNVQEIQVDEGPMRDWKPRTYVIKIEWVDDEEYKA